MSSTIEMYDRQLMIREKRRVAFTSVIAALLLTGIKLAVGIWTGSLGIISEAAHSGLDLLAAGITFFAVRIADRPPDKEHNFGHGKVENLSALAETSLLLITCVWILYEAFSRLATGRVEILVNEFSFAVILISIAVDFGRSRALSRVAKKYNSQALEADALHFRTDIYSSLVVLVGLICVWIGFPEGDALAAIIVAGIVIWISFRLGKRTIDVLLDRVPLGMRDLVSKVVLSIPGVEGIRSLRLRESGANTFVDLVIEIRRTATFEQVHQYMDAVEHAVRNAIPRSDVIVHSEPVVGKDKHLPESVNWLIQQTGLTPHNVSILETDGKYHIELDIEYPVGTTFKEAHELASDTEEYIRKNIPNVDEVCIHLEEQAANSIRSEEVTDDEPVLMDQIKAVLAEERKVRTCNSAKFFRTARGMKISLNCSIDKNLTLKEAHSVVNTIEHRIRLLDERIVKVLIHAEPV